MRKVFIVDHDFPATADDIAAAEAIGSGIEVICGIPEALAAVGVATFGYHEIVEPPTVPQVVEKRKIKLEMLATPWPPTSPTTTLLAFINAAVAGGSEALQIEWADANEISRTRDLVLNMKAAAEAAAGLSTAEGDALMDQLFTNANARP